MWMTMSYGSMLWMAAISAVTQRPNGMKVPMSPYTRWRIGCVPLRQPRRNRRRVRPANEVRREPMRAAFSNRWRRRTSAVCWPAAGAVRNENSGDHVTPSPTR